MSAGAHMLIAVLLAGVAMAVEHAGVAPKDAKCTWYQAAKITGKSVHSVMATSFAASAT
jgi:hypothetical protein